jgi:hypothetical protein
MLKDDEFLLVGFAHCCRLGLALKLGVIAQSNQVWLPEP